MFYMKKRVANILLACALLVPATLTSCGDQKLPDASDAATSATIETITEITPQQQALIDDVTVFLNDMYEKFNNKDFTAYLDCWHIDETEKNTMLENLKESSSSFDTKYKIVKVFAQNTEDDKVSVSVTTEATSVNLSSDFTTLLKETQYFILSPENDTYYIVNYAAGESEIVTSE